MRSILYFLSLSYLLNWIRILHTSHAFPTNPLRVRHPSLRRLYHRSSSSSTQLQNQIPKNVFETPPRKGKILVLGGSGFLGGNIARRGILEGYQVVSLSRTGSGDGAAGVGVGAGMSEKTDTKKDGIDYRSGDARDQSIISSILEEGGYIAVYHCIGLLFDQQSGFSNLNRFASGSGSIPDASATYDDITRVTAFNAIEAAEAYSMSREQNGPLPFIFISAAEVGWKDVTGGNFIENNIAPKWLKRYLKAKRAVEDRLETSEESLLRQIIFRPSLIYSLDRISSLPPVSAFFVGNKLGLPFVDRPGELFSIFVNYCVQKHISFFPSRSLVTVQALSFAAIKVLTKLEVSGVQRFKEIDKLNL